MILFLYYLTENMDEYINFENEIISKLKDSGLIKRFSFSEVKQNPDIKIINQLFLYPIKIDADDQGIFYFDEGGDKIYCPSMAFSITDSGEWLSDKIPPVPFDIEQSGNVRKAEEAESIFCLVVISIILKEPEFRDEILKIARSYDFVNMKNVNEDGSTFRALLNDWQDLQSTVINIIISACKFKISFYKKDIEKFLRDGMSREEVAELRDLDAKVRSINFTYSEGILSPENVKKLTKIERLQAIDRRDREIETEVKKSPASVLYKLSNLSSEYISPIQKKKIQLWVKKEVDSLFNSKNDFSQLAGERSQILVKLQRRALRFEKNSVRKLNIEKYLANKNDFKMPTKL